MTKYEGSVSFRDCEAKGEAFVSVSDSVYLFMSTVCAYQVYAHSLSTLLILHNF